MIRALSILLLATCTACSTNDGHLPSAPKNEVAITFKSNDGQYTDAFEGSLTVPENRSNPNSRDITLKYVRFPASSPNAGPPIIYLAGGPGGSGISTAEARRYPLFQALRQFGDVIALDQRGTGKSNDLPNCISSELIASDQRISRDEYVAAYQRAVAECLAFWEKEGIDIYGYTTRESVQDLAALRKHLGAKKMVLWGTSYGSHLALAALKDIEPQIDRVVISSAEGLDQTVKLPARSDGYLDRLQAAINTQPAAKAMYPDIKAMMRRVMDKAESEDIVVTARGRDGSSTEFLVSKMMLQQLSVGIFADPESASLMLANFALMDMGQYGMMGQVMSFCCMPHEPIRLRPMSFGMDYASGISKQRLELVNAQASDAVFGDYMNFPMPHILGTVPELDLGDAFREGPESDVPTLLLTGTLDGRTFIEGQSEATAGLSKLTQVIVVNAGHNLFMSSPEVTEVIEQYMATGRVDRDEIIVPLPDFANPSMP